MSNLKVFFVPLEKERVFEVAKGEDVVAWSKDIKKLVDQQEAQGFRCTVIGYNGGMFQLFGFCGQCGSAIIHDWSETSGLPGGIINTDTKDAWCSRCYLKKRQEAQDGLVNG